MSTSVDVEQTDHTDHKGLRVQLAKEADIGDDTAIAGNPAQPWSLPELASLCNMSRATFVRHFHQAMGRSASNFLLEIKMSLASKQLRQSSLSTGEIAETVGYLSEAAFQRAFKQYMRMTPALWRRTAHSTS